MSISQLNLSNKRVSETTSKTHSLLMRLVLLGICLIIISALLESVLKGFFNLNSLKIQYVIHPLSFLIFYSAAVIHIHKTALFKNYTTSHKVRFFIYNAILFIMIILGIINQNPINLFVHEAMWFFSIGVFLLLGSDEKFTSSLTKIATLFFWLSFILCLLTYDIPLVSGDIKSLEGVFGTDGRYTDSIAYSFYRKYINFALPLFIYGWMEKRSRWHYLQIFSLVGFLVVNVMIFKFRGPLVFAILVSLGALLFVPAGFTRKLKLIFLGVIAVIFVFGWMYTDGGNVFKERMEKFDSTHKMVNYRLPETERYLEVVGYEWLWGRGMGGNFQYNKSSWGKQWDTLHIGWMSFTLKGGVPLMLILLTFFGAWINKVKKSSRRNPYIATAWCWAPILCVFWIVNPVGFHVSNIPVHGLSFLLLSQFGRRTDIV